MSVAVDFLERLCSQTHISGFEHINGNVLTEAFAPYTDEFSKDGIGSYIFKSNGTNGKKIMLSAHVDEIGLMITDILDNGFLAFCQVGGINPPTVVAQEVTVFGKQEIYGVIGIKPPHLTTPEDLEKAVKLSDLYIDTGLSKEAVEKIVSVGDTAIIKSDIVKLNGSIMSGRAFDDKAGVAIMLSVAENLKKISHKSDIYYTATVQEEVGIRGAKTAAYTINPDVGIVLEVGFAKSPEIGSDANLDVGKGPGIYLGGRFNHKLNKKLIEVCKENRYPYQILTEPGPSGTDTESIQVNMEGVPCVLLAIPLRYMHTCIETLDAKEIDMIGRIIAVFINELDNCDLEEILCF